MAKIGKPSDVQYLALQGGGGKGFAYIGAIEALEQLGILPSKHERAGGTLLGLSGTSAGGIMAFLLAMGCTSKDLLEIFRSNEEFLRFFDGPESGFVRAIRPSDWQGRKSVRDAWAVRGLTGAKDFLGSMLKVLNQVGSDVNSVFGTIGQSSTRMSGATLFALWLTLTPPGRATDRLIRDYPFLGPVSRDPTAYLSNFIYDRGLFPGFAVREFLRNCARTHLPRHKNWTRNIPNPADITFAEFKEVVGKDLVLVGTNLSRHESVYFSAATTPNFRVVEAVGISACFPLIFKPIWIEASPSDPVLGLLRGYWVDGGILNNIPIHAFDGAPTSSSKKAAGAIPMLNPVVLGLALRPGAPLSEAYPPPNEDDPWASFALDLIDTTLYPAGPGQYATSQERDQVIDIFSYSLSLFDFAPSEAAGKAPRQTAYDQVIDYFARR